MANQEQPVIIIRRKKKGGHGGHHGGAWKVAYADFVTAMMSFFLLMWLLNVTTSDQRKGLADYFAPSGVSKSQGGSGGLFGGLSFSSTKGARLSSTNPPGMQTAVAPDRKGEDDTTGDDDEGETEESGKGKGVVVKEVMTAEAIAAKDMAAAVQQEQNLFKEAEAVLKRAINESDAFRDLAQSILVDQTPEGLRIQIVDREKFSMFPSGNAIPFERGRELLRLIGRVVARLPNHISISGHTDSSPFAAGSRRDNWDLSTERANISRATIVEAGVDDKRISRVVGLADREPLLPSNPMDPKNRRISIVLLRSRALLGANAPVKPTPP